MKEKNKFRKSVRQLYIKLIRNKINSQIALQRIKLVLWDMYPYFTKLGTIKGLNLFKKLALIIKFLKVDWRLIHAHKPIEIMGIWAELDRLATKVPTENRTFVEAGCFNGGSSCKFSLLTNVYGWRLKVYDSFEGVESIGAESANVVDYSGAYAAPMEFVRDNIRKYGNLNKVELIKGWFSDTFKNIDYSPSVIYIDCDLKKGTHEVIEGARPKFNPDTILFSQDYSIVTVKDYLNDPATWTEFNLPSPTIRFIGYNTVLIHWNKS